MRGSAIVDSLVNIVGSDHVRTRSVDNYLVDETAESVKPKPATDIVVVKPASTKQVSQILRIANELKMPVFPRGGGTGLVGGAIPLESGIVISFERMNRIEIDSENLFAVAEAGATLGDLLRSAEEAGLSFPPHPGDESAQVGGLVATNAGGARALRFGVMRNYVKGLEVVLASGDVLSLGGKLLKNNVGYDLIQLIIGSEGTLAVITRAALRLYPKFGASATLILPFKNRVDAMNSVPKILQDGRMPLAIEYVEKDLMKKTAEHIGETWPIDEGNCYLLITEAEPNRDQVLSESLRIAEICKENGSLEPLFAEPRNEQERILRIRSNIYSALKPETADILDVTVPPADIGKIIEAVEQIATKYTAHLPAYGHAGDGNLHVHITKKDLNLLDKIRAEIYRAAINLGGVITGEHGIGKIRIGHLQFYMEKKELELMRKIKHTLDPNGILNPGTKIAAGR